jgi:hypothetical protein
MKLFLIALGALAVVHTVVSFAAYQFLTPTKLLSASTDPTPVDTTTPEQRARGESSFRLRSDVKTYSKAVPTPVIFYMVSGYAGLAAAVLYLRISNFAMVKAGEAISKRAFLALFAGLTPPAVITTVIRTV